MEEIKCKIKGPNFVFGDTEWECITHGVDAVLRDPSKWGAPVIRREDFICPVEQESNAEQQTS